MDIRTTVVEALQKQGVDLSPQYTRYAEGVIVALETREAEIVSNLTLFASEQGLPREAALDAMADCGLETSGMVTSGDESPVAEVDPRITAIEAQLASMQETLRALRG